MENLREKTTKEVYSFENDMKETTKKKMALMNLILGFAVENEMAFEEVGECVEKLKERYLKDGIIRK